MNECVSLTMTMGKRDEILFKAHHQSQAEARVDTMEMEASERKPSINEHYYNLICELSTTTALIQLWELPTLRQRSRDS